MPTPPRPSLLWLAPLLACLAADAWADSEVDYVRLGWKTREQIKLLPVAEQPTIGATCSGAWITPIPLKTKISDPYSTPITAQAANAHYDPKGSSVLSGSVSIQQGARRIEADDAEISQNDGKGSFSGNILILEPGLVMSGQKAYVDFASHESSVQRAEFVTALIGAHGRADQITRNDNGVIKIARGEFTTCEPTHRSWYFVASNIRLDHDKDRGEVRNATLYVADLPVMYLPYFNFPLDGARKTGMLAPRFGNTNDGGFDLSLPVYLNLAPNYDATLTPRLMTRRGTMAEGEFRYLLPWGGTGSIDAADLPNDKLFDQRDRKGLFWKHSGELSEHLSVSTNINYVSDNAYFTDLGNDLTSANTTYEERTGELRYHTGRSSLLARVQTFQTIDPTLTDSQKPYSRLPELQLNLGRGSAQGWQPGLLSELTNFQRQINDGSGSEINGGRYRLEPSLGYALNQPWGFLHPEAKLRYVSYDLTGDGVSSDTRPSMAVPDFTLDSGLVFERDSGRYNQTFEPRAFYLLAPYRDQSALPVFDTTTSTFSYSQLFRGSRFSGGDRLDDANQLSLGATTRFIDPSDGSEQLRASLGEIFYFRNRLVTAPQLGIDPITQLPVVTGNQIGTAAVSGLAGEVAAQFSQGWGGSINALQSADGNHFDQLSFVTSYLPRSHDRLLNLGYNFRREDATLDQQALRQTQLSFVQPLTVNWQILGLWQYDLIQKQSQDLLAGVEYDGCCYSLRLIHREYLTNPTNLSGGAPLQRTAWFVEFRLKGLAGLGSSINSLLGNNVYGYTQLLQNEDNR
jgi:LPS-assembly protein